MRYPIAILAMLLVAGCGRAPEGGSADEAMPGVNVTAAPGVAFRYRYDFRLPAARIAAVQEAHAAACERLGVAKCRITAMRYTRGDDNRIEAMLGFALAPELARGFGREGVRGVEAAEGMVLAAEITGEDAGARIAQLAEERDAAARDAATAPAGETRDDRRLRQTLADNARRDASAGIAEQRAALAATPVVFDYRSGSAIRGFDPASPFTRALDLGIASTQWTIATALALLGLGLPPLALFLIGLFAWRRARRAWTERGGRAA